MRTGPVVLGIALTLALATSALVLSTCGGGQKRAMNPPSIGSGSLQAAEGSHRVTPAFQPVTDASLNDTLTELDALETPAGVDPALFAQLKDTLAALLTTNNQKPTTARFASTPPTGDENRVTDLTLTDNGDGTYTLTWHYRNLGDYDQNGTVGISDITPIAMHYGETYDIEDLNCLLAVIDGSGNGIVDIADVTPLAMNLGVDCAGYVIMQAESVESEWQDVESVTLDKATGNGRLEFTHSVYTPIPGMRYVRVVSFDADGNPGVVSGPVEIPIIEWVHTWGGSRQDIGWALAADENGNVYMTGGTCSFGARCEDVALFKYDPSGSLIWKKTWGGTHYEVGFAIVVDGGSNVYVTGRTMSFGVGSWDVILLKYDSSGNLLWQKTWGESHEEAGYAIAVDGSGDVYVTGYTGGFGAGNKDIVLLKYDPSGTLLWGETYGGGEEDWGQALAVDGSGGVYVAGWTNSFGAGDFDILLLKYGASGSLLWQKTWGGSGYDAAYGVAVDEFGDAYITGKTDSFGAGSEEVVLLKYDSMGSLLWQRIWGRGAREQGYALAIDRNEDVYVTGFTRSSGPGRYADVLLLRYDSSGNLLQQRVWGGSDNDCGCDLAVTDFGEVYIGGSAPDANGSWLSVSGDVSSPSGSVGTPNGSVTTPTAIETTPEGTETLPGGVEDEGGGDESDVLVMKIDPSSL